MAKSNTRRKTNKKKNSKLKFFGGLSRNKRIALVFVVVFAVFGGYRLYKTYANPITLTSEGAPLLIERQNSTYEQTDTDYLAATDPVSFRLYDNGLAVCGDYKDAHHPERYYSTQLNEAQKKKFVSDIEHTGFNNLEKSYGNSGIVLSSNMQYLALNTKDMGKVVSISLSYNQVPKAYADSSNIISVFCAGLTQPYVPSSVEVTTKTVEKADKPTNQEIAPTIPVDEVNSDLVTSTQSDESTKAISKTTGRSGVTTLKKNNKIVQVRTDPLPKARPIVDKVKATEVTTNINRRTLMSSDKVSAAPPPVKMWRFCSIDFCDVPRNSFDHIANTYNFYWRTINQVFDYQDGGKFVGRYKYADYRYCHAYFEACTNADGRAKGPLENTLMNLLHELYVEDKWDYASPKVMLLGFNIQENDGICGVSSGSYFQTAVTSGISTFDAAGRRYDCTGHDGRGYAVTAHEFGHNLGLYHINNETLMNPSGCHVAFTSCQLDGGQGRQLINSSPYLYPHK